jgi:RluA family pseudouridine synthase
VPLSPDRILFLDDHLLAVAKRAGELTVRGAGAVGKLPLFDYLRKDYPGIRVLHRLDFDTSGVVTFARTKRVLDAVRATDFRGWKKIYRVLVAGRIDRDAGVLRAALPARGALRERRKNEEHRKGGGELIPALTRYKVLERFANSTYVECAIETGRHHQIRRHFAGIGHPLVLDAVYGVGRYNQTFSQEFGYRKFFLHALSVEFPHPITGKQLRIDAPLPRPFEEVLERLRMR